MAVVPQAESDDVLTSIMQRFEKMCGDNIHIGSYLENMYKDKKQELATAISTKTCIGCTM
jgi:hypothetical protein